MAGWEALVGVGVPLVVLLVVAAVINVLQRRRPGWLPALLRSWDFLPLWAHSLEPWDRVVTVLAAKCCCCCKCCQVAPDDPEELGDECCTEPEGKTQEAGTYDNPSMSEEEEEAERVRKMELKILNSSRL